jgi:DNA polymerase-1
MKKISVLLIDGDNLAHRALHKFANLTTSEGEPSGVVFGVPYILGSLVGRFKPDKVIVVFDGGRAEWRTKLLPTYKEREKHVDVDYQAFYRAKDHLKELLPCLRINVIWERHQEADDIIAAYCFKNPKQYITIVSSDKDFHQLVNPYVKVYRPSNDKYLTSDNLYDEEGYYPDEVVDYLSLIGDKSDRIPGVAGMGPKRSENFLYEWESIERFLESDATKFGSITKDKFEEVYNISRKLINLKYAYVRFWKRRELPKMTSGKWDDRKARKLFGKYQVNLMQKENFVKSFRNL